MSERGPRVNAAAAPSAAPRASARPKTRPADRGAERPKAPWHPVPLTEVAILAGGVAMLVGFARGKDGVALMFIGLAICGLAVAELSAREHFSGYRSHSLILALIPVVILEGLLYGLVGISGPLLLAIAVPVFISLAFILRARYREARMERPLPR